MTTFSCRACGSPSFTIHGELSPMADVCCTSCGAALGTWETVLRETTGLLERLGVPHRRHGAGRPHPRADATPAIAGREREGTSRDPV